MIDNRELITLNIKSIMAMNQYLDFDQTCKRLGEGHPV